MSVDITVVALVVTLLTVVLSMTELLSWLVDVWTHSCISSPKSLYNHKHISIRDRRTSFWEEFVKHWSPGTSPTISGTPELSSAAFQPTSTTGCCSTIVTFACLRLITFISHSSFQTHTLFSLQCDTVFVEYVFVRFYKSKN